MHTSKWQSSHWKGKFQQIQVKRIILFILNFHLSTLCQLVYKFELSLVILRRLICFYKGCTWDAMAIQSPPPAVEAPRSCLWSFCGARFIAEFWPFNMCSSFLPFIFTENVVTEYIIISPNVVKERYLSTYFVEIMLLLNFCCSIGSIQFLSLNSERSGMFILPNMFHSIWTVSGLIRPGEGLFLIMPLLVFLSLP